MNKVLPVVGDIQQPDLGLKKEDQEMLQDQVSVVFHLAATIHFTAPLRYMYMTCVNMIDIYKCRSPHPVYLLIMDFRNLGGLIIPAVSCRCPVHVHVVR